METNKITISDIITIKGGTIEELYLYAKQKGINLPNNPEYVLSPSQLHSIDPKLAFNIKYGRISPINKNYQNNSSEDKLVISPETPHQSNKSKNDFSILKDSSHPIKKIEKKQKKTQRIIGIVKFFDKICIMFCYFSKESSRCTGKFFFLICFYKTFI